MKGRIEKFLIEFMVYLGDFGQDLLYDVMIRLSGSFVSGVGAKMDITPIQLTIMGLRWSNGAPTMEMLVP